MKSLLILSLLSACYESVIALEEFQWKAGTPSKILDNVKVELFGNQSSGASPSVGFPYNPDNPPDVQIHGGTYSVSMDGSRAIFMWLLLMIEAWVSDRPKIIAQKRTVIGENYGPIHVDVDLFPIDPEHHAFPFQIAGIGTFVAMHHIWDLMPDDEPGQEKPPWLIPSFVIETAGTRVGNISTYPVQPVVASDVNPAHEDVHPVFGGHPMSMKQILILIYSMMLKFWRYNAATPVTDMFPDLKIISHVHNPSNHYHVVLCICEEPDPAPFRLQDLQELIITALVPPILQNRWEDTMTWFSTEEIPAFGYLKWWAFVEGENEETPQSQCPRIKQGHDPAAGEID